ncbi:MAG TPA: outer membrane protein assembly factor BamC [Nitrococcus sp.]|nr:outer membrane protein assembly factor BamC [Nitrococcus sp.]
MSRLILVFLTALGLSTIAGCMSAQDSAPGGPSAEQLKLPPDLIPDQTSTAMAIPPAPAASAHADQQQSGGKPVLPKPENATMRQDGRERWLEVQAPPSQVWQEIEAFVKQHKLVLTRSDPQLGVMETAWRYSAMPMNRDVFAPSKVDRAAASVADRYVIRLEEGIKPSTTEVFVAHRCVARNAQGDWRLRDADPFLEAEFMRALLASLGGDQTPPATPLAQNDTSAARPQMQHLTNGTPALVLPDRFFTAWREVGLALDRAGFTVVDRDRSERHYFVRYDTRADAAPKEKGFWDTVAFWRHDIPDTVEKYRLDLTEANDGTQVTVYRSDGAPAKPAIASKILGLIEEQLR